jgi:hypothetical protein
MAANSVGYQPPEATGYAATPFRPRAVVPVKEHWVSYGTSKTGIEFFYEENSVTGDIDTATLWVKMTYSDLSTQKKFRNLSYSLVKISMKCKAQLLDSPYEADYNADGLTVKTVGPSEPDYAPIAPGTINMALWNKICG